MKRSTAPRRRIKTHHKTKTQKLPANIAMLDSFMAIFGFKRVGAES